MPTLIDVARRLDRHGTLTHERAAVLQQAAAADRPERFKCTHADLAGAGWSHPWPDEEMYPHACCREHERCPAEWFRE